MEDYKIVTNLEDAKPVYERISELAKERMGLAQRYIDLTAIGDMHQRNIVGHRINSVKTEMAVLRDSIEYVRIKTFIMVVRSYLNKNDFENIFSQVDEILSAPELHLMEKRK